MNEGLVAFLDAATPGDAGAPKEVEATAVAAGVTSFSADISVPFPPDEGEVVTITCTSNNTASGGNIEPRVLTFTHASPTAARITVTAADDADNTPRPPVVFEIDCDASVSGVAGVYGATPPTVGSLKVENTNVVLPKIGNVLVSVGCARAWVVRVRGRSGVSPPRQACTTHATLTMPAGARRRVARACLAD